MKYSCVYVTDGLKVNRASSVPKSVLRYSLDKVSNCDLVFLDFCSDFQVFASAIYSVYISSLSKFILHSHFPFNQPWHHPYYCVETSSNLHSTFISCMPNDIIAVLFFPGSFRKKLTSILLISKDLSSA